MADATVPRPPTPAADGTERRALRVSSVGYLFMAALGIGFAISTRSSAILLDGVYSLVSFGASLVAIAVARLVDRPGSESFHFGFAHFEPFLNMVRGLLILGIAAIALISAVDALFHGGRPIMASTAVLYGAVAAGGCLLMAWNQRRLARRASSPLLQVDARSWFVDGILSLGAFLAFLLAYFLEGTSASHLAPYVDPALVTLMVFAMARVPMMTVWENLREVLQVAPEKADQAEIRARVEEAVADLPTREVQIRMVKVGRFFYLLTHIILPDDWEPARLKHLDEIRCRIARSLEQVPLRLVTDTVFTAHPYWTTNEDHRDCEALPGAPGASSDAEASST